MKIIEPFFDIMYYDKNAILLLEKIGRTCYKSEDKISEGSAEKFVDNIIKRDHTAMIEHSSITVRFTSNRGFSHEMVRHRLASFAQESSRYCNYSKDKFGKEITVIRPYWWFQEKIDQSVKDKWESSMQHVEDTYNYLNGAGLPAQACRGVLPIDLKTEIVVSANMREWRAIFKLRTALAAHPDMRRLMVPLLREFKSIFPILFDDITEEV